MTDEPEVIPAAEVVPAADFVPENGPVLTDDELATQQAAGGAPGTAGDKSASVNDLTFTAAEKAKIRANIRWIMTELDWARSGRLADEREELNP